MVKLVMTPLVMAHDHVDAVAGPLAWLPAEFGHGSVGAELMAGVVGRGLTVMVALPEVVAAQPLASAAELIE